MSSVSRGEVYELRPPRDTRGHEQRGSRFAVVVQSSRLAAHSTVIIAPTSTSALATSFRPEVEILGVRTLVMVDQLRALDVGRLGRLRERLHDEEMREIDDAMRLVLGLVPA